MSLLEIDGLGLRIGTVSVLEDVSFSVGAGEIVGVIGESGSGKSMTALSVMQLLPQGASCTGRITLAGRDVLAMKERALCRVRGKEVGMVFQEPMTALNLLQTIGDQVAETVLIHERVGRAEAMSRAAEALERVELPQDRFPLGRYPHELSGGQRQRVGIAMAIALRPKLLIADEPTTALDVTIQGQILYEAQKLCRETGTSMIWITHDLAVVAGLADKICVMYGGRIVEQGSIDDVLDHPVHPYTRGLLGSVPGHNTRGQRLYQIPGMAPSLLNLPQGCAFQARCPRADDACNVEPEITEPVAQRAVRCFHPHLDENEEIGA